MPRLETPVITGIEEPDEGHLLVYFEEVEYATGYKVWDEDQHSLFEIESSPYYRNGVLPDKEYTFEITATDGSEYEDSDPARTHYISKMKCGQPQILNVSYSVNATGLIWSQVSNAESYSITRDGTEIATVTASQYTDYSGGAGTSYVYRIIAEAEGRWNSTPASVTTSNKPQLQSVTNLAASQTVSSVTLTWTNAPHATSYVIYRNGEKVGSATGSPWIDDTTVPGTYYQYKVISTANGYWNSYGATVNISVYQQLETPDFIEAMQTQSTVTMNWTIRDYGTPVTFILRREGSLLYQGHAKEFTDGGLTPGETYSYTLTASIPGSIYYESEPAVLEVLIGRVYTPIERQKDYWNSLKRPFRKLCRLRFLNPNGTTAFALDNNPRNKRSRAFIASGSVSANLQNGPRYTATVTLYNADGAYETAVNKIWFGQEVALDEGLVLSNGEEYYRQTGVFLIDNPTEKIDPQTRTVTYNLVDKWSALDGTLGGNLEGNYEVPVGTNIFAPITALLEEDKGNGQPIDQVKPAYTEYYNDKTQTLTDGTEVSMILSPYTLVVNGDGGTVAQVLLKLAGMVNAWIGYDNTGRLRIDPSQDDILDIQKPILWRFSEEETQLLGMAYTVKKEEVYNDYIVVGEQLDDYTQPGGRATNSDPRSDTNVNLIGRRTKRESASGYATDQQCLDLAEWRLIRSSSLQRAVSVSCSQMMHIDLNSLVEIVRSDKEGSPVERHLIQGFTRPLAYSGAMTIRAVSVNDLPILTLTTTTDFTEAMEEE